MSNKQNDHFYETKKEAQKEVKRTPPPWYIETSKIGDVSIVDENGLWIAHDNLLPANAAFIVRAVNSHEALLRFAQEHHEVCSECEGTGKVYNNADPTSGQWIYCPYAEAIRKAEEE